MKEIRINKYVPYLFGLSILLFLMSKVYLRPWILENEVLGLPLIVTNSLPNFLEAIIGTLILTGILLQIYHSFIREKRKIKVVYLHILAVLIASIYVIAQELKFHNLGGNNIYDPYDLLASFVGLIGTFGVIQLFGFSKDTTIEKSSKTREDTEIKR
jgi:uncharacterized membrane protein